MKGVREAGTALVLVLVAVLLYLLFLQSTAASAYRQGDPSSIESINLQTPAKKLNPREIGSLEADVRFTSAIESSVELSNVNYSAYVIINNYRNLISSNDYSIVEDEYGNKLMLIHWKTLKSDEPEAEMRVSSRAVYSKPAPAPYPYDAPKAVKGYLVSTNKSVITDEIRAKAYEIISGSESSFDAVARLSHWVYTNVAYDDSLINAIQPSDWVFEYRRGTCDEFSNLFIAMSRAVGIPARYVAGVTYSKTGWGYHGWAEVYLGEWIPIDPTWDEIGWLDAAHLVLGRFTDSDEVQTKLTYMSSGKPIIFLETPSVDVDVVSTDALQEVLTASSETFPAVIGLDDYAVVELSAEAESCLATAVEVVSRVDSRNEPAVDVEGEGFLSICPGETKRLHFLLKSRSDLDNRFNYYDIADIYTFLGDKITADLRIHPGIQKDSSIAVKLQTQSARIGEGVGFEVVSDTSYRVYSDLEISGGTLIAGSFGEHYIIAINEDGEMDRKTITVSKDVDFRVNNIELPDRVSCGEEFNISLEIENVLKADVFEIDFATSSELSRIDGSTEVIGPMTTKRLSYGVMVDEECTGDDQLIEMKVNGRLFVEKVIVDKPEAKNILLLIIEAIMGFFASLFGGGAG